MALRQSLFGPTVGLARLVRAVNEAGPPAGDLSSQELSERLARVLRDFGEVGETAADVLPHARAVEELLATLYAVLAEADAERAAARLNELLSIWTGPLRLHRDGAEPWHLHAERDDADGVAWFAASSVLAIAVQFAERGDLAWGVCQAAGCERIYVREGPGRPRSTCSTACATRRRQAEFRARQRES